MSVGILRLNDKRSLGQLSRPQDDSQMTVDPLQAYNFWAYCLFLCVSERVERQSAALAIPSERTQYE